MEITARPELHIQPPLRITSCQAPNADAHIRQIAAYLGDRLGLEARFVGGIPWQDRQAGLDNGEIQAGWICGLPYVVRAGRPDPPLVLLAAPVMAGERYADRPVYFSDVVVRKDSPYQTFAGLAGAVWAYNEPLSHSGYGVVRSYLARRGWKRDFFGQVLESGAHQTSLDWILSGMADASAIDSTVLETELANRPEIAGQIRVIESLGPSPIPPWVVHHSLPETLRNALRETLLDMARDPLGQDLLAQGRLVRFTSVTDAGYDPIRVMLKEAEGVEL